MTEYRYLLDREADMLGSQVGVFVMLNPSTADETTNDPTIRRCLSFAMQFGWLRFRVVNLFAMRATKPRDLLSAHRRGVDIVGPMNDSALGHALRSGARIVAAWGASGGDLARERASGVAQMVPNAEWWCLGTTDAGDPRHPLYVRAGTQLVRWEPKS